MSSRSVRRRKGPWYVLLVVLGIAAFVAGKIGTYEKSTTELPVYVTGAERMIAGEEIYRPADAKPFTYPPFFGLPFVPFTWLPDDLRRGALYVVNVACLVWLLVVVRRATTATAEGHTRRRVVAFWIAVLVLSGRHLTSPFENQSHDLLVAACVGLAALAHARRRDAVAGAAAGLGAAAKATPLLFGLLFAVRMQWRAGIALAVVAVAATLLPDLLYPRDDGRLAVAAWAETFLGGMRPGATAAADGAWSASSFLNQSLSGTLHRLTTPVTQPGPFQVDVHLIDAGDSGRRAVIVVMQLVVVALLVVASRTRANVALSPGDAAFQRFGQASAIACGMVLLSPMSSKSHFCVLLFGTAFCVADWLFRRRDPVVLLLLLAVFAAGSLTAKGIVGRELGNVLLARGTVTFAAFGTLLCIVHVLHHRPTQLVAARTASESP